MTHRRYCFTLNNTEETELEKLLDAEKGDIKYAIWQLEKGEGTRSNSNRARSPDENEGTLHIQGYVELARPQRYSYLHKWFNGRAHWEEAKGSRAANIKYCSKEDTRVEGPWTMGEGPQQGKRNDLLEVKDAIQHGASDRELAENYFPTWTRNFKSFREYRRLISPERDWQTSCIVLWGTKGTGKSSLARRLCDGRSTYWTIPNSSWWDGYEGQEFIIIDEYDGSIQHNTLLRLLDCNPLQLEIKGGTTQITPRRIFITSQTSPQSWYNTDKFDYGALARRIDIELEFVDTENRILHKGPALQPFWFNITGGPMAVADIMGNGLTPEEMKKPDAVEEEENEENIPLWSASNNNNAFSNADTDNTMSAAKNMGMSVKDNEVIDQACWDSNEILVFDTESEDDGIGCFDATEGDNEDFIE